MTRPPDRLIDVRRDRFTLALLVATALVVSASVFGDVTRYIRGDWPTMFFPFYKLLGERLRAFDIPGWNPDQFAGVPFAADPSSGWWYLPAMALYALFPAEPATALFIGFHVLLSAIAAYALARLTGLSPAGALVAGFAFTFPWLVPAAAGAVLLMQITTWLPIALIGVELARRPSRVLPRLAGIALAGLALCLILASWLGQGAYYSLLVIGGWVAWRTLVTPPGDWTPRRRLINLAGIGGGVLLLGFALNAAALLPRLEANTRSNAAGGIYTGISAWSDTKLGTPLDVVARSLAGGFSVAAWDYVGAAVLALALLAPFVATRWPPLLFWLIVPIAAIILVLPEPTPLKSLAYALLPRFELIHTHLPDRILMVVPLAAAMLAGATTDALVCRLPAPRWRQPVAILAIVALAAGGIALERGGILTRVSLLAALAALAIAAVAILLPGATRPALLVVALAAVILWDPVGRVLLAGWGPGAGPERSLHAALGGEVEAFLHENGAAAFLRKATSANPGRYAGYDPALLPDPEAVGDLPPQAYRNHWLGPANWLLVQNWGTWFGVEDVQGYNPIHIKRYGEYIDVLNGHRQEYHETDIFPGGLDSPLLAPLNLRYLIIPADAPERPALAPLLDTMPAVYDDARVIIVENRAAFPRAWLVHEAEQVPSDETLPLLANGTVDPARTALLEVTPPPLAPAADPGAEAVSYIRPAPDRITVEATAQAPGLLMLSEIWDPGWQATIDGEAAPTLQANSIFLAIPIAAGQHRVELHYTPPYLWLGLGISAATLLLLLAAGAVLWQRERRHALPPVSGAAT